jgi:prepilin signal peptidase PulO-like enzyme (type II secretory pathway)
VSLLVECLFGVLFVLLYHFILSGFSIVPLTAWLVYYTVLFISLGVVALYDYKHSYVPVVFLAAFLILSFGMLVMHYLYSPTAAVLLGPLVVALPFLSVWVITKGRGLGLGDVLLYAGVGAFFGIEQGLAVLLLSVWIGAVVGAYIYLKNFKQHTRSTTMPFVPYIVLAFFFVLFTDIDVFSIASIFS